MENPRQYGDSGVSILADSDTNSFLDRLPGMAYRCSWDNDWTMDYLSRGALALSGYSPEDLVGNRTLSWSQLILSDDLPDLSKAVRAAIRIRKPFQCVYRLVLLGGVEKWVIDEGRVISDNSAYPHILEGFIKDITDQKAHEADLKEQREQSRHVVEKARDAFLSIDVSGKIRDWNHQAETTFGWPRNEIIGKDLAETLIPEKKREGHNKGFGKFLETQANRVVLKSADITGLRRNGQEFPAELTIWPCRHGENQFFNAFVHDLSERKAMSEQLSEAESSVKRLMRDDLLTGLANRKALEGDLVRATSFARRWKQPLTLVLVDLDSFKDINEEFGSASGDQVLVSFAQLLKLTCRTEDFIARFAGEEFGLLLPNTDVEQASVLAERLQKKMKETPWPVDTGSQAHS